MNSQRRRTELKISLGDRLRQAVGTSEDVGLSQSGWFSVSVPFPNFSSRTLLPNGVSIFPSPTTTFRASAASDLG